MNQSVLDVQNISLSRGEASERRGVTGFGFYLYLLSDCIVFATLFAAFAPTLVLLLVAQFLAGGCWGAATVAAYSAAVALGRAGREGRFLGTLFAVLAVAVAARITLTGSGLAQGHFFSVVQPWLPQTLWLCAALLLSVARFR